MNDWRPATVDEVSEIVATDLKACDAEQLAAFQKYGVEPFSAPIMRHGKVESVVVIARNGDQVIYWEDVEDGFNVSPIGADGTVLEPWGNENNLRFAFIGGLEGGGFRADSGGKTAQAFDIALFQQQRHSI